MRFFWTIFWAFLLSFMITYVISNMVGGSFSMGQVVVLTILFSGAAIVLGETLITDEAQPSTLIDLEKLKVFAIS